MMIHGCVVEDHCDIIPFLLASWRAKKLPIKNACMIHFDSHPDLSIPKQNMKTWSNLKQVYELLGRLRCTFKLTLFCLIG